MSLIHRKDIISSEKLLSCQFRLFVQVEACIKIYSVGRRKAIYIAHGLPEILCRFLFYDEIRFITSFDLFMPTVHSCSI